MADKLFTTEITPDKESEDKRKAEAEAKKKKEERLKKEAQAKLPKPKFYYDIKIESLLPSTLTYRILAEDAQQAAELIKNVQPNSVQHRLIGRKDLKLTVYDAGSTFIRFIRRLAG